ncbi:hypothetical protein [Saccharospirillum impatiens]|uniref:hypothetical protein n=1 Tax=Saccharospirillum impatiens TaxID=169438 RepID=UPI00041D5858|nr:hypothetical protein [Saccharospirillum impatiens]
MAMFEQWVALGYSHGPTLLIGALIALLGLVNWRHGRKIRQLEARLGHTHQALRQEVKMMGQGAIGVGHRVKHLEKQMRTQPSPFEQLLMHGTQVAEPANKPAKAKPHAAVAPMEKPASSRGQSRAEQALAQWMSDTRHTA